MSESGAPPDIFLNFSSESSSSKISRKFRGGDEEIKELPIHVFYWFLIYNHTYTKTLPSSCFSSDRQEISSYFWGVNKKGLLSIWKNEPLSIDRSRGHTRWTDMEVYSALITHLVLKETVSYNLCHDPCGCIPLKPKPPCHHVTATVQCERSDSQTGFKQIPHAFILLF